MKTMVAEFDDDEVDTMCAKMMTGGDVTLTKDLTQAGLDCEASLTRNPNVRAILPLN